MEEDDPGGSRFNEMAKLWNAEGHDITVIAGMMHYSGHKKRPEYRGKWVIKKKQGNTTVWRTQVSESYNKSFIGRLWAYFSFVFSSLYCGIFKVGRNYDVILVTSPPLFVGISGYLLSKFKRTPFIFEVRDLWPESAIDTEVLKSKLLIKLAYNFESFIYKKAKLINVLTPAFRTSLIDKGVDENKIIFIPNASDFSLSDKLLNGFNSDEWRRARGHTDKFVITYVGAHGVANHLKQLIDVAIDLRDSPVVFQLIGDGMEKQELMNLVSKKSIQNIEFVDSVPKSEVFKYILGSDMGASILKKADTFKTIYSNKTFDYMACKKPVLMLIDGISRQLVEQAGCGFYAEPENAQEIVKVIRSLINEKEKLKETGINGYHYAKANFDRQKLAKKYITEVKEALV
ncbi:MAG: glycosyltransferase family 4 protein [Fulvivirga sp.]|uniref:glycosyltransferase family 4 protein n=1 Tax=Fulvivirga sp. TaxID=1931237 RepID=UPI0032EF4DAA